MAAMIALPADDSKEQVRNRVNIVDLVGRYVKLKPAGRSFKGLCPFHKEKTPSFTVSPDRGTFHCFGCGKGGDVFSFVQEIDGVDFREALESLATEAGVTLSHSVREAPDPNAPKALPKSELIRVHSLAMDYYYRQIKGNERVVAYLKKRGLKAETVREFMLGFAPPGWSNLGDHLRAQGVCDETLVACGLAIEKSGGRPYDRFRDRLMFTLFDTAGKPVAFAGRGMADDVQPKYLNSPETAIYRKSRILYGLHKALPHIKEKSEAIVVEGYMDYLALYECGVRNVVATSGTALTADHAQMFRRYTPRVVLLFDGDAAGVQAAWRGVFTLAPVSLEVRVLILPEELDPDEFVRERGADAFNDILARSSRDGLDFVLQRASQMHPGDTPHAKSAAVGELIPLLDELTDDIVRTDYVKRTADHFGVAQQHISARLKRPDGLRAALARQAAPQSPSASRTREAPLSTRPEGHFLRLLLSFPQLIPEAEEYVRPETLTDRLGNELYSIVLRAYEADPSLKTLMRELTDENTKSAMAELASQPLVADNLSDELAHTVIELQKKFLRNRIRETTIQLRKAPADVALLKQQQDLATKLRDLTTGQA